MRKKRRHDGFPTFPVLLFVIAVLWLFSDLGIITFEIPWWPVVLIVLSLSWIVKFYSFRE